jgi:hypothetical protein
MDYIVTTDISQFGYIELETAGKLLSLYSEYGCEFLTEGLTLNFNQQSGYVFLSDTEYHVGVLDESEAHIVQFFTCSECGYEGTQESAAEEGKDFVVNSGYCSERCFRKNR